MRPPDPTPPPPDRAVGEAQARLAARLATLPVQAPPGLHAHVAELTRPSRRPRRSRVGLGALAGAAASLILAAVWIGQASLPAGPSVAALARFAFTAAAGPVPAPDPADPAVLRARVGDVPFPRWGPAVGFSAVGQRTVRLAGREVVAVAYRSTAGTLVGYSIAAAPPLARAPGTPRMVDGQRVSVGRAGAATTITWRRDGHTCVLAADGVAAGRLITLALAGY